MTRWYFQALAFFLSSATIFSLILWQTSRSAMQQLIAVTLVVFLLVFYKIRFFYINKNTLLHLFPIYIASFFVQLLVIGTGSFYSPFLILIHISVIAVSFLLNFGLALIFLVLSFSTMTANILLTPNMLELFENDPNSLLLYISSFVVVIPLTQRLTSSYRLKDTVSRVLGEYIQLRELREKLILGGLNDFVVITDNDLNIVYANEAMERALAFDSQEAMGKPLLSVLGIVDYMGNPPNVKSLSIEDVIRDKTIHIVEGFSLPSKNQSSPQSLTIQVRPIVSPAGQITQIVFVMSDSKNSANFHKHHINLAQAELRYKDLLENLRKVIVPLQQPFFEHKLTLIDHVGTDIMAAQDLRDHAIDEKDTFQDINLLCKKIVAVKQGFAQSLKIKLESALPDEKGHWPLWYFGHLSSSTNSLQNLTYVLPIKLKWFNILIEKLVDLALLLASSQEQGAVLLTMHNYDAKTLAIKINTTHAPLGGRDLEQLFTQYYGELAVKTNLHAGSGLEGFLARTVANQLSIPIIVQPQQGPYFFAFEIRLGRA